MAPFRAARNLERQPGRVDRLALRHISS